MPYEAAWERQEQLFDAIIAQKRSAAPIPLDQATPNTFVLCEHPHVYTLGKHGNAANLLVSAQQLALAQATYVRTNRGGDITYHGPGQIVGYPIFDLESFGIGLKQYIHCLEEVILRTLAHFGIAATRLDRATGVWLNPTLSTARKIAAIGVRSSNYVTMHGFALNVNTDLNYFRAIHPCGFVDKGVTSMQHELGHTIDMHEVKQQLMYHTSQIFTTHNSYLPTNQRS